MNASSSPLVPPIAPSAVYRIADLDALDAIYAGADGFIYARDAHPNALELAAAIDMLHGAAWGQVVGSGMAALSVAFLALCQPGDTIVAADQLYGKTFKLLADLARFGVAVRTVDAGDLAAVETALAGSRALLVETIANPLMALADLPALAKLAHAAGAKLIVDNTFAGPTIVKPLSCGADIVMESLTKMINGHSDVTLGYLGGRDASLKAKVADTASTWGFYASPFDCWLAQRGLGTLPLRMSACEANAKKLAAWLPKQSHILRVLYPNLANMLAFEIIGGREAVNRFFQATPIPFCPSLGHHESTLSYPWSTSHRAVSENEKLRLGITPGLVRLSVGCEAFEELQSRIAAGIAAITL